MVITKLKQVEKLAKEMFNCVVRPVNEVHAKGYLGIKLIVGQKPNIAYNPAIDPNNPPDELRDNPNLLKTITSPMGPDVRIIWMPPGTTDKELVENFLKPIQKSLKEKTYVEKRDTTVTKIGGESDADIAAKVARGEAVDSRYEDFAEGYDDENDGELGLANDASVMPEQSEGPKVVNEPLADQTAEPERKPELQSEMAKDVLEAIQQIASNIDVLSNDVSMLNDEIMKIEGRLNSLEDKPKKGRKKKEEK